MPVRVLRLLEYTYPDAETAVVDMDRWQVPANGTYLVDKRVGKHLSVRSATIPMQVFDPDPYVPAPPAYEIRTMIQLLTLPISLDPGDQDKHLNTITEWLDQIDG